jgi:hypothetical protein
VGGADGAGGGGRGDAPAGAVVAGEATGGAGVAGAPPDVAGAGLAEASDAGAAEDGAVAGVAGEAGWAIAAAAVSMHAAPVSSALARWWASMSRHAAAPIRGKCADDPLQEFGGRSGCTLRALPGIEAR